MTMMIPPTTIVFRRPSQSPTQRFERAPIRQPTSCTTGQVREAGPNTRDYGYSRR